MPVRSEIDPLDPAIELPVDKRTFPDVPAGPDALVSKLTAPEDVSEPIPLESRMLPPVDAPPVPPDSEIIPPWPSVAFPPEAITEPPIEDSSFVRPARIVTFPPTPDRAEPTVMFTIPPEPHDLPVDTSTEPAAPVDVVPVESEMLPLVPTATAESGVMI